MTTFIVCCLSFLSSGLQLAVAYLLIIILDKSKSQSMLGDMPVISSFLRGFSFESLQESYLLQGSLIASFFLLVSLISFFANTYIARKNPEMYRIALAKAVKAMNRIRDEPKFARSLPKEITYQTLKRLLASELRYIVAAWAIFIRSIPVVVTLMIGFVSLSLLNMNLSLVVLASVLVGIPLLALPVLRGGAIGARIMDEGRKQSNFLAQEGERLIYDLPGTKKESDNETIFRLSNQSELFLSALVKRQTVSDVTALVVDAYVVCLLTAIIIFILNETASGSLHFGQAIAIVIVVRLFLASVRGLMRSATNFYAIHPIIQNMVPMLLGYHELEKAKVPVQQGQPLAHCIHLMVTPKDVFLSWPVSSINQIGFFEGIERDITLITHNKKTWVYEELTDNKFAHLTDEQREIAKELMKLGHALVERGQEVPSLHPSEEVKLLVNVLFVSALKRGPIIYLDSRAIPNRDANVWEALAILSRLASIIIIVDSDTRLELLVENITRYELDLEVFFADLAPGFDGFEIVNYGQTPLNETQWAELQSLLSKQSSTQQGGVLNEEEFELIG